jgi:hypothetical protein
MTSMTPNQTATAAPSGTAASAGDTSSGATASTAQEKMSRVADEAPAQLSKVTHDVKTQLRESTQRTLGDVRTQADDQATRAAQGLRDLSTRAQALADGRTEEAGNLSGMVETLGRQASDFAQRLESGGVQGLLDDTARFGRRRPMAFLALAVGAGFVAGRLARTGAEVAHNDESGDSTDSRMAAMAPPQGQATVVEPQYTGVLA